MTNLQSLVNDYMSDHKTIKPTAYERDWNNDNIKVIEHWNIPIECYMDIVIVPFPVPNWLVKFVIMNGKMPKLLSFVPYWIV